MSEEAARAWIRERFGVSRETQLERYVHLLVEGAEQQNLIASSTIESVWERHILDSVQLVPLGSGAPEGPWIDIGSGAGLPGIVAAVLTDRDVVLVEPRARRVDFLRDTVERLGIGDRVTVAPVKIERYRGPTAAIISARAVMELSRLFASAREISGPTSWWLLPKGRNAQSEVEDARRAWQGSFHVEQSITQPDSLIVVAREVRGR